MSRQFCQNSRFGGLIPRVFQFLRLIRSDGTRNIRTFAAITRKRHYYLLFPPPALSRSLLVRRCFVSGIKPANIHPTVRDFGACLAPTIEPCSLCPALRVNSARISPPPPDSSAVSPRPLYVSFFIGRRSPWYIYFVPPSSSSDSQSIPSEARAPLSIRLAQLPRRPGQTGVGANALTASGIPSRSPALYLANGVGRLPLFPFRIGS